jgi:CBS domain-containing protein
LARQTVLKFGPYDRIVKQILELAISGASKKDILNSFSFSRPQLRRVIAELESKDFLRYDHTVGTLMTSAKGNIFLKSLDQSASQSLRAKDISHRMIMLDSEKTLLDARNVMLRYNISRVVIFSNGNAVGIVTEKDIGKLLYESPRIKRLNEIALKELIQKTLVTINENDTVDNCSKLMLENNISSLVITDDNQKDKGIITKTDIVELYANYKSSVSPVHESMQKRVQTVAPDETIHMISMLMNLYKVSHIVVKENKRPVGIVTTKDFLPISISQGTDFTKRNRLNQHPSEVRKRYHRFIPKGFMSLILAQDIMSHPPITVHMNTSVSNAALMMIRNQISGLPVIDRRRQLVGIITKTDVLKNKFGYVDRHVLPLLDNY